MDSGAEEGTGGKKEGEIKGGGAGEGKKKGGGKGKIYREGGENKEKARGK